MATQRKDEARHAEQLVRRAYADELVEHAISLVLADIRHLCDREGLDYGALDRDAYETYLNDLEERGGAL